MKMEHRMFRNFGKSYDIGKHRMFRNAGTTYDDGTQSVPKSRYDI
jgi:hypothetical protein